MIWTLGVGSGLFHSKERAGVSPPNAGIVKKLFRQKPPEGGLGSSDPRSGESRRFPEYFLTLKDYIPSMIHFRVGKIS